MYRINLLWFIAGILSGCMVVADGPTQNEKASKINVQLGIGYYQQGNLEMANEKLVKALTQDPNSSQAHYAYAVLQNRFLDKEKTEFHFRKAIDLDPENSEALSNFGAYLCNDGRLEEADKMFMQAVKNPLYKVPEIAYTNAAVCLLKFDSQLTEKAKGYYKKALAARNNYPPAVINMAGLIFAEGDYELTKLYLQRYHSVQKPTARSLWLDIRNELKRNKRSNAIELAGKLKADFPNSEEYKLWLTEYQLWLTIEK